MTEDTTKTSVNEQEQPNPDTDALRQEAINALTRYLENVTSFEGNELEDLVTDALDTLVREGKLHYATDSLKDFGAAVKNATLELSDDLGATEHIQSAAQSVSKIAKSGLNAVGNLFDKNKKNDN